MFDRPIVTLSLDDYDKMRREVDHYQNNYLGILKKIRECGKVIEVPKEELSDVYDSFKMVIDVQKLIYNLLPYMGGDWFDPTDPKAKIEFSNTVFLKEES